MVTFKRNESTVVIATLALLVYTLTLSLMSQVASTLVTEKSIGNVGSMKALGVEVYWDASCTNAVSYIDWGVLEPGSSENVIVYIRNKGDSVVSLSMNTSNWGPSTASNYIALTWDYEGQNIDIDEVITVAYTLSVSPETSGIESFSFEIVVIGSGVRG